MHAALACGADQRDRAGGGDVGDVQVRPGQVREGDIARDERLLGAGGAAAQTEPGGDPALVHLPLVNERRVFAVLRDRQPKAPAYSRAWRINRASATASPSSESATTPACASSPAGASSLPARSRVMQPSGSTRTAACSSAWRSTDSTAERRSSGGSVFGIAQTVVKPPRAAAAVPLVIVSLYSKPGLAQVDVQVHEAGRHDQPGRVDAVRLDHRVALVRPDAGDSPVDDHDVGDAVAPEGGVDHAAVVDGERAHRVASPALAAAVSRPSASR